MKKLGLFLFIVVCLYTKVSAQLSLYNFSQTTTTYTSIASLSPSTAIATGWDDNASSVLNIGFSFVFNGTTYTQFYVNSNGYINFGGTTYGSNYYPISSSGYNAVSGIGRDLVDGGWSYGNGLGNNAIKYITTGTAGNHVLTVEWKNAAEYYCCSSSYAATLNFQIKLYESGNKVEVVYGTCTVPAAAGTLIPQVGLGYSPSSQYNNRTTPSSWAPSVAGTSNTATANLSSSDAPASGTTYDWQQCSVTVTPTNNSPVCLGSPVQLTGTNSGGITYAWSGPGGFTSTLQNPIVSNGLAGTYTFTATGASCGTSGTTTITNSPPSSVGFSPASPNFCAGSSGPTVTASVPSGTPTYAWTPATGLSCTNCAAPAANPTITTTYSVTATIGLCSATNTITVTVNPIPTASVTPTNPGTVCGSQLFTGSSNIGDQYQWYNTGGAIFGANTNTYTATAAGTYHVNVTKVSTGCTNNSVNVTLGINPLPSATTTPSVTTTTCFSQVMTASTDIGNTFQWYNSAGIIAGATATTYTVTTTGTYHVQVTKTSTGCINNSTNVIINISGLPTASISTPGGATSTCGNSPLLMTAVTNFGDTYHWNNSSGPIPGATQSTYNAPVTGTYSVLITKANTGCSNTSATLAITVNANPTAAVSTQGNINTQCGSLQLNAVTDAGDAFQWYKNGTLQNGATAISYSATSSGTYTVKVTKTSTTCNATSAGFVVTINPNPTATVTAPNNNPIICGTSLLLTANTDIGNAYQWYSSNGVIPGAVTSTYTANISDGYSTLITNTVTGCSTQSPVLAVAINANPTATISTPNGATSCGNGVAMTAITDIGTAYQWYSATTGIITGATNAGYSAPVSDDYYVKVTRTATGCNTNSANTTVIINAIPNATATPNGSTTFCQGANVTLASNAGNGYSYQWQNSGNDIGGATNINYVASTTGVYTVRVNTPANCNATSASINVTVNQLPTTNVLPVGATSFCQGENVTLVAPPAPGYTYQWMENGNNINGSNSQSYTASTSGTYSVHIADGNNCSATSQNIVVTVNELPVATSTANGVTGICPNTSVTLSAGGNNLYYQWLENDSVIYGATASTYIASEAGAYVVTVRTDNNCRDTAAAINLVMNASPVPTISLQLGKLVASPGYSAYQWYLSHQPIQGATSNQYSFTQNGAYNVEVTDNNGCTGMSEQTIVETAGVESVTGSNNGLTVYPNPNTGVFTLNGTVQSTNNKVKMEVIDMNGRVLMQNEVSTVNGILNQQINLDQNTAAGMYAIKVISDTQTFTVPFVKK